MLIAFEGIDGTGKTTQAFKLHEYMRKYKIPVKTLKFPSKEDLPPYQPDKNEIQTACRYISDFARHYSTLMDGKLNYANVILDRYFFSTAAYQAISIFNAQDVVTVATSFRLPIPDVTFYLTAPVKSLISRLSDKDRWLAQDGTLERAQNRYKSIIFVSEYNFIVIDATQPEDVIERYIASVVDAKMSIILHNQNR